VEDIKTYNPKGLSIYSGDVLSKIQNGDPSWENLVPPPIAQVIKAKGLFGYKPTTT
jgi:hypothetical protein